MASGVNTFHVLLLKHIFTSFGRGFSHLSSIARKRLVDGLCSNLSVLGLSIGALVSVQEPDDAAEHEAAATSHRSALTAYVFLLSWLARLAEGEAKVAASTSDSAAGKTMRALSFIFPLLLRLVKSAHYSSVFDSYDLLRNPDC